jgi:Cu(I)/Ag(I) efflux system membrane protein CusA/SilA
MPDRIIRFSVNHRWPVIAAALLLAVIGMIALNRTPIDAVPDLSENQVIVSASWPGHGPVEIESLVTRHIARSLQSLEGARSVRGASEMGYSLIHVIFHDAVSLPEARHRVQEGLAGVVSMLPPGVTPALAADGIATGQIYWYTVEGRGVDIGELRRCQDEEIAPLLSAVPGVAEVASVGGFRRELHINVSPEALIRYGLRMPELIRQLQGSEHAGGQVIHQAGAELVLQVRPDSSTDLDELVATRRLQVIHCADGRNVLLQDLAEVVPGPAPRRGTFEKDGSECVAGIVHLRYGHNPLEVTRAVQRKLQDIAASLPPQIRIVPCYDRTPLIHGAVRTVSRTLAEALIIAAVCVLIVLRHLRAWLVIAITLPLCVLAVFPAIEFLRLAGITQIQTNIMSLAGIVISIGVLVDSSIVMTENVMHRLRERFGDDPVSGDVTETVSEACRVVGRPVFFSIVVMLISFVPVFALQGIDGRMYGPLAWTKTLALIAAALLAVTLVPALCSLLVRGHMRDETESAVVRGLLVVYRPLLQRLLDRPLPLLLMLSMTIITAAAPPGINGLLQAAVLLSIALVASVARSWKSAFCCCGLLLLTGLSASAFIRPIAVELRMPLYEGIVMDMPISVPGVSAIQATDDMKTRNMQLCRFPEVRMVTGKAGRADTPFDPAPLDMIETMIEFLPVEHWPKRCFAAADAERLTRDFLNQMAAAGLIEAIPDAQIPAMTEAVLFRFDAVQRETAWQLQDAFRVSLRRTLCETALLAVSELWLHRGEIPAPLTPADAGRVQNQLPPELLRDLEMSPSKLTAAAFLRAARSVLLRSADSSQTTFDQSSLHTDSDLVLQAVTEAAESAWDRASRQLDMTLAERAVPTFVHLASDEMFARAVILNESLVKLREQVLQIRRPRAAAKSAAAHEHQHGLISYGELPFVDPHPVYDRIRTDLRSRWQNRIRLQRQTPDSLSGFGGEMDRVLQMPGWTNVWTRPIQNRVDMLATGINSEVGVRVLGQSLDNVVAASEEIAEILRDVPGAADVVADPVRGRSILRIRPDAAKAAMQGVAVGDVNAVVDHAFSGRVVSSALAGKSPVSIRVNLSPQGGIASPESLAQMPLLTGQGQQSQGVPLAAVSEISLEDGPAIIRSENGWLRNYVRLNVRGRDPQEFVQQAQQAVGQRLTPRPGIFVEWTGQYEHAATARRTLLILMPIVVLLIFLTLYWTYRDAADALLMLLTAPGALAGGILCQWLLGYEFSVAVGVGYIACFGMAASTGVVMLVYLRQSVDAAGGLQNLTIEQLRTAVMQGAVQRLRPKLLTEATTLLSLAPMIWSTGTGAEIIRPMAAPVLGGILVADEIIDLLIPILFYHVRRSRLLALQRRKSREDINSPENHESDAHALSA